MKVTIDGQSIEVEPGTTILQAARMIGGDVVPPAMCYYSKLKDSGGKCRTCIVEVSKGSEKDPRPMPKLVASCRTTVMDGMEVKNYSSEKVLEARKGVVEFLLINHPLDCPICDQAGECHLQDLAYEHGAAKTRYEEERRTFDRIDIGSKIQLHMTRCILCYRCVFTADQITNKRVHGVLQRGDSAEIGTYIENVIENDFSGNVIDVCPVGALTDKTFRFKSRVWFAKPQDAHRDCSKCCGKTVVWTYGNEVYRVTARKDKYDEVIDFICNDCRFEHKKMTDWVFEGPTKIERHSVISANKYQQGLKVTTPQKLGYGNSVYDKLILATIVFAISLGVAAYATWAERKLAAFFQDRIGPNRAGVFGLLQPIADGVKLFMKEEIIPADSDKVLFIVGPSLFMITALMTSAVIPWSTPLDLGDRMFEMQVADINIGILYVFAVVSIGVYGIMIGGWASNNKYSLMGAIRASSQMISYELAMGLSIIAIIMMSSSMSLKEIVAQQGGGLYGIEALNGLNWNIFYQPLGFLLFLVCAFAECNRTPFDLPECEAELGGGFHIEYSSMKLGLFLFAEYVNMFISSAVIASLFFGGYNFPGMSLLPEFWQSIVGVGVFMSKIAFFIFFFMWVRWTIPRFRYDQLMNLGWKILLPLAILNIVLTGGVMLFFAK